MTAGIYAITNVVNGHQYVGQTDNIARRWALHRSQLGKGKHHSPHLQSAWDAYGGESFTFTILEVVVLPTQETLNARERYFFDLLSPIYVVRPAGSQRGYQHRVESRAKMSAARSGRVPTLAMLAAAEANRGKTRSQATRDKISATKRAAGIRRPDLVARNKSLANRERVSRAKRGRAPLAATVAAAEARRKEREAK